MINHSSKIIITGGLGYIGSHTVVELQSKGFEIVIVDDLSNSSIEVLDGLKNIIGKNRTKLLNKLINLSLSPNTIEGLNIVQSFSLNLFSIIISVLYLEYKYLLNDFLLTPNALK